MRIWDYGRPIKSLSRNRARVRRAESLPEKQGLARGRPLATYVRCDVGRGVERETGIEPV